MKKTILPLFATTALLFLSGCTGSEIVPNDATQAGVVTGALTGAAIGYNTKGHHKGRRAALGALAGAAAGGVIGNAVDENYREPVNTGGWHE